MTCLSKRAWIRFIFGTGLFISLKEYRRRMEAVMALSRKYPTTIEFTDGTILRR